MYFYILFTKTTDIQSLAANYPIYLKMFDSGLTVTSLKAKGV